MWSAITTRVRQTSNPVLPLPAARTIGSVLFGEQGRLANLSIGVPQIFSFEQSLTVEPRFRIVRSSAGTALHGMPNLKKLLGLKPWLTVPDAARHLGVLFDEDVSEADVLRLALDRHLKLSVNFVNHAHGRPGRLVPVSEAKRRSIPSLDGSEVLHYFAGYPLDDNNVIEWEDKIITISGVWDLAMVSAERIDVERRYQQLTCGPPVELFSWDGPIVGIEDGSFCEIRDRFSDEEIADLLGNRENSSSSSKAKISSNSLEVLKEDIRNAQDRWYTPRNFFPAAQLPNGGVLVVRTSALKELEAAVSRKEQHAEKPIERRERTSLLVIIAALAKMAKIDVTKPSAAAISIETQTELMGTRVASRTIENHLSRIPEALESREGK